MSNLQKAEKKKKKKREENHNFDFINFRILIRLTKKKNKTHISSIIQEKKKKYFVQLTQIICTTQKLPICICFQTYQLPMNSAFKKPNKTWKFVTKHQCSHHKSTPNRLKIKIIIIFHSFQLSNSFSQE